MKTFLIIILLLSGRITAVFGQEFEDIVDFEVTLESLAAPSEAERLVRNGRIVLLEGLLSHTVIDENLPGVVAELVGGSWIGTSEVRAYRSRLIFSGESWMEVFPARVPREPGPSYIPLNSRILVAARIQGRESSTGYPIAKVLQIRVID